MSATTGRSTKARSRRKKRRGRRTGMGQLFRRANRWQRAVVVVCGLVVLHGLWVIFVPGVPVEEDLPCPPAVVAAVAGSAGMEIGDATPEIAAYHDTACAAAGRWYVVTGLLQIGIAAVWALATLEWARLRRRAHRRRRRQAHEGPSAGARLS